MQEAHYSEDSWQRDDLPFTRGDYFEIRGTNNLNQVIGNKNVPPRPFIATKGENGWVVKDIFGNTEGIGRSYDINDSGILIGHKYRRYYDDNSGPFLYIDGKIHVLKDLIANGIEYWEGVSTDTPKKINNSGQIIGNGTYNGKRTAFLLTPLPESIAICEVGLDPQTIKKGEGSALWWWSTNASSAIINNNIGNVELPSNYQWINPTKTQEYIMNVTGTDGITTQCKAKVIVEGVCELGADPQTIQKGEGAALWWWTDGVDTLQLSTSDDKTSGVLPIFSESNVAGGYQWLYPQKTTTYKMKGLLGETPTTCETTIIVNE